MLKHKKKIKKLRKHIEKKILLRARIYAIILFVMLILLIRDIVLGILSLQFLVAGIALGIVIGILASRMFQLTWDHDSKKIIARLDTLGFVILFLYIFFSFFRNNLVTFFIQGPSVGAISLAIITGSFLGQLIGMRNGVKGILQAEGITK